MAAPGPSSPTRLFNSSVTSRRFPALRTLTAEDVEVMVMPPAPPVSKRPADKGGSAHLFDPNLVKPSAVGSLGTAASAKTGKQPPKAALNVVPPPKRPPFRPCNPTEARTTITEAQHGYVSLHSPYDLAHRLQVLERHEARAKERTGRPCAAIPLLPALPPRGLTVAGFCARGTGAETCAGRAVQPEWVV